MASWLALALHAIALALPTMTLNSTSDSASILKDGKLKPGIYEIQNIYTDTYLDVEVHTREVCCRPAKDLKEGRGRWEIKQFGAGYTVQRVDPGKPEQFCTPSKGIQDATALHITPYPVAWNVVVVDNDNHRGFEYVRFHWGTEKIVWDLAGSHRKDNGALVRTYGEVLKNTWQIWNLIPVKIKGSSAPPHPSLGTPEPGPLPLYERDAGQPSNHTQYTELECDEVGTVVNEVTVVTTTVTTRRKYRVEGA